MLSRKRYARALKRVKALADALGERRDRDVAIEFLAGFAGGGAGRRPEAARRSAWSRLREEQRQANEGLAPFVAEKRLASCAAGAGRAGRGGAADVKARPVKGLDPTEPLRPNAARIVRTRLDELRTLAAEALEPGAETAQHDMRIAAKRLRYVLEITGACFGPEAEAARVGREGPPECPRRASTTAT